LASALRDWGIRIHDRFLDPAMLNRWLARNDGFAANQSTPNEQNLFRFGSISPLGVDLVGVGDYASVAVPAGMMARYLADPDSTVLAEVDFRPGGTRQQHWVRLLPEWSGITQEEQVTAIGTDVRIMDPWMPPGLNFRWMMPAYATPTWDGPSRAIFRLAIYHRRTPEETHPHMDAVAAFLQQDVLRGRPISV